MTNTHPVEEKWLFGYGSIMWKTGFSFEASELCFVDGWSRRFWQASTDHRGTPESPGRVVTLIESPGERCWGMAYRLPRLEAEDIIQDLDYREKGGYERATLNLNFGSGKTVTGLTYIAYPANPHFLGDSPLESIAQQITHSTGPSGSNKEYILRLYQALEQHKITDAHIEALTRIIRRQTQNIL